MKQLEIVGFKRANLGRPELKQIRDEGNVPAVLYGGKEQVFFHVPAILFRPLLFTPDVYEVTLNIEGKEYKAIFQDAQFHPVSDMIIHADFLEMVDGRPITVEVPIKLVGTSVGVMKGGRINLKLRKLRVKGLAKDIPDYIEVNITRLDLGKSVKVAALKPKGFEILTDANNPIVSVNVPRTLKGMEETEEEETVESAEGGEAATEEKAE